MKGSARRAVRAPSEDTLRRVRIPLMQRGTLTRAGDRVEPAFFVDVGLLGLFVEREEPLPVGEELLASFRLPDNEIAIGARCRVAWWHPPGGLEGKPMGRRLPSGLGLEFVEIGATDLRRVRRHLLDYLGRQPRARRFIAHPGGGSS